MTNTEEVLTHPKPAASSPKVDIADDRSRGAGRLLRVLAWSGGALVLLVAPFLLPAFWLQILLLSAATGVAALGLRFLVGVSGQLSLAHGFFVGIGAYAYCKLGPSEFPGPVATLGLPSVVAALGAVALAGLAGLLFSPVASRLKGIYLALATLSLVTFGTDLLLREPSLGGAYGIDAPQLTLGPLELAAPRPAIAILGTPFGTDQRLWFLVVLVLAACYAGLSKLERSRAGRALRAVRDSPAAAASVGVHVQSYRCLAFVISSVLAGLGGVLLALVYQHVVPENFGLTISILYLAMVVIGGPRSAVGSLFGALLVTALPLVLARYSSDLPYVAATGENDGLNPGTLAQYFFAVVVVAVLMIRAHAFDPWGTALRRLVGWGRRASEPAAP